MFAPAPEAAPEEDSELCPAANPFSLASANINPLTGLSTDYLNHFNEAIMLLELIPLMPECRSDFTAWRPLDYHEHFSRSRLAQRELAVVAYDLADIFTRRRFDALCASMSATVLAAQRAMGPRVSNKAAAMIAAYAAGRLRPLISHASALIHGDDADFADVVARASPQAAVDAIIAP